MPQKALLSIRRAGGSWRERGGGRREEEGRGEVERGGEERGRVGLSE